MEMLKRIWKWRCSKGSGSWVLLNVQRKSDACVGWFQWSQELACPGLKRKKLVSASLALLDEQGSPVCLVGKRGRVARSRVSLTPCIGPETTWQHWKVSSHIWLLTLAKLKRKKQCSVICVYFSSSITRYFRKSNQLSSTNLNINFFHFLS